MTDNSHDNLPRIALKRAQNWLQSAQRGLEDDRWDDCVYNAQMAAEQAIKGLFIKLGVYYKRIHDVSEFFRRLEGDKSLPTFFREKIQRFSDNMEELTSQRNLAGYGFEEGIGDEYFKEYAPLAFQYAQEIVADISKVLDKLN